MDILKKLFIPLNYLKIGHKQKLMLDLYLPVLCAAIVCGFYFALPVSFDVLGKNGLFENLNKSLQVMSGFYIAALGAIATFPNKNMDCFMDGGGIFLNKKELTRRQFLSYLFGYLAFLGFAVLMFSNLFSLLEPSITACHSANFKSDSFISCSLFTSLDANIIAILAIFLYILAYTSIVLTTLLGVYYLTYKIHQNKAKFV